MLRATASWLLFLTPLALPQGLELVSVEWQPSENGGPPKFVEIPGSERVGGGQDG